MTIDIIILMLLTLYVLLKKYTMYKTNMIIKYWYCVINQHCYALYVQNAS